MFISILCGETKFVFNWHFNSITFELIFSSGALAWQWKNIILSGFLGGCSPRYQAGEFDVPFPLPLFVEKIPPPLSPAVLTILLVSKAEDCWTWQASKCNSIFQSCSPFGWRRRILLPFRKASSLPFCIRRYGGESGKHGSVTNWIVAVSPLKANSSGHKDSEPKISLQKKEEYNLYCTSREKALAFLHQTLFAHYNIHHTLQVSAESRTLSRDNGVPLQILLC